MTRAPSVARLRIAAVIAAAAHVLAGLAAARYLLPAVPAGPVAERLAYVQTVGWGWRLAWLAWVIAGATLVWVLVLVHRTWTASASLAALWSASVALGVDTLCDGLQAWWMPRLAHLDEASFLAVERWLVLGGYVVANGLYSVAALLGTWVVADRGGRVVLVTGLPLAVAALCLAWAAAVTRYDLASGLAAATVALAVPWLLHLGWNPALDGHPRPAARRIGAGEPRSGM